MAEGEGYLPPVVVEITGDDADLLAVLARDKAALLEFANTITNAQIGGDSGPLDQAIADATSKLTTWGAETYQATLGAEEGRLDSTLATAQAAVTAFTGQKAEVTVGADGRKLPFDMAAAKEVIDSYTRIPTLFPLDVNQEELVGSLAASREQIQAFADQQYFFNVHPEIDDVQTIEQFETLKATLAGMGLVDIKPSLDPTHMAETIAGLNAITGAKTVAVDPEVAKAAYAAANIELDILAHPIHVEVIPTMNETALLGVEAQLAVLKAQQAISEFGALGGAGAATAALAGGGGGGPGLGTSLLAMLGFGTSHLPFLGALPGVGTLGAMAGLGPEHVLGTAAGIAGFAGSALAGGGLLAAGTAGVAGVGAATNMAGLGQAAGDARTYTTDLNALNKAIAVYGAGSLEAAAAQYQLNQDMAGLSPAALSAVKALSAAGQAFHMAFDAATSPAEAVGAQILAQAVKVGEAFLPTLGAAALKNMGIIKNDIQPLFTWLQNTGSQGGVGIFSNLERIFTAQLPTAIHAGTEALELFARTINVAAGYTGQFLPKLDAFLTRWNSLSAVKFDGKTEGFAVWSTDIGKLIGDFRILEAFLKSVGRAFTGLLAPAQGTGRGVIEVLTGMINQFDAWERSAQGISKLTGLLQAHKRELIEILKILPSFVSAFGMIELTAGPALTNIVALLLRFVNILLRIPGIGTLIAYGAAFGFIASKMKLLGPLHALLFGASEDAGTLEKAFSSAGTMIGSLLTTMGEFVTGALGMEGATEGMTLAMGALGAVGIIALAVGVYELVKHFGVLRGVMIAAAGGAVALTVAFWLLDGVPVVALVVAIGLAIVALIAGIIYLATHWKQVWTQVKAVTGEAVAFVKAHLNMIALGLVLLGGPFGIMIAIALEAAAHWKTIWAAITTVVRAAWSVIGPVVQAGMALVMAVVRPALTILSLLFRVTWGLISTEVRVAWQIISGVIGIGVAIVSGIIKAGLDLITGDWTGAWNAISSTFSSVVSTISSVAHSVFSDIYGFITSTASSIWHFLDSVWQGILRDVQSTWGSVVTFLEGVGRTIVGVFSDAGTWLLQAGKDIVEGALHGIESVATDPVNAIKKVGSDILGGFKSVLSIFSPSGEFSTAGGFIIQGVYQGVSTSPFQGSIGTNLSGLAKGMLAYFGPSLQGQFYSAGANLMLGLSNGIASVSGQVAGAAASAANAAVAAANAATKTHSPSLVFAEMGQNWMLGLVQGIAGSRGAVQTALNSALPNVGRPGATAATGGLSGAIKVQATFQINAPGGNPVAIKEAIEKDSAEAFAKQILVSMRAGAGTVY